MQHSGETTFHHFSPLFTPACRVAKKHVSAALMLFRRRHGNSADRKRRRNNASACSTQAKQLSTTFYHFSPLPACWRKSILAWLGYYSAACMVIPPTKNAGGIMQALAAPRRNNFSQLFTTFHLCLLCDKRHVGATAVFLRHRQGTSNHLRYYACVSGRWITLTTAE